MIQTKNIKLILNYFAGPLVFCVLLFSIYTQLHKQTHWQASLYHVLNILKDSALTMISVVLLMILNWGIEAWKWHSAMRTIADISYNNCFKAIFSGSTLAFFTPNRTGEYFGRMIHLEEGSRIISIPVTIVCNIAQLLITLFAGCLGLLYLAEMFGNHFAGNANIILWIRIIMIFTGVITIVLTIFYFRMAFTVKWLQRRSWMAKLLPHVKVLEGLNATIMFRILSLSGTRYLVFILQYFLLFRIFGVQIEWWQAFWSVSVVFLVIAIVPGMGFLSELGIRWQASIQLLQLFSSNVVGIFATSLAVWMINLVIPALIGGLLIIGIKLFRK